jgi:hypothetical protein
MKKLFSFSAFVLIGVFLIITQMNLSSCTKNTVTTIHDTTTIVDTVKPVSLTSTQILSSHIWEIYELFEVLNGDTSHYLRGVVNTTGSDQDIERFTFNENGSGNYIGPDNNTYSLTWQFTNSDQSSMQLTTTYAASSVTYNWELVSISDSAIYQTTPETNGVIVSAKLVPVP